MVATAAVAVAACGRSSPAPTGPQPTVAPPQLNTATAADLVTAMSHAGLPVDHVRDVSAQECGSIGCTEAVSAGAVTVFTFSRTGAAERYAASIADMFQVENVVVVFSPAVPADRKAAYRDVVQRAVG